MSVDVGSKTAKSEPNVVPLCDIQKGANVTLPEAKYTASEPDPSQMFTVYVKKSGEVALDDVPVGDLAKLGQMILDRMEEMQRTEKKVLLKADLEASYGRVVDVMNAIKEAQIEVIGLVTEQKASTLE
jgi:biopolymer transport protein TolR